MTKLPSTAQIIRELKIDTVMARTGCACAQARAKLIAEGWSVERAVAAVIVEQACSALQAA